MALFKMRLLLSVLFVSQLVFAQDPLPADLQARLQAVLDENVQNGYTPGVLFAVSKPGFQPWLGVAGNSSEGVPIAADDQVRIGSVTKTFTSMAFLYYMDQGNTNLSLDATLAEVLPEAAALLSNYKTDQITMRMLLNHTSGLYNYVQDCTFQNFYKNSPLSCPYTLTDYLKIANLHPPTHDPGTHWAYSNTGYILLGMVLEKALGMPYWFLIDELINAFGLTRSQSPQPNYDTFVGAYANGYINWSIYDASFAPCHFTGPAPNQLVQQSLLVPEYAWSAGDINATASDLMLWMSQVGPGTRLNRSTYLEQINFVNAGHFGYGLGLMKIQNLFGLNETIYGHEGEITGYNAFAGYVVSVGPNRSGVTLVQLLNRTVMSNEPRPIFTGVLDVLFGDSGNTPANFKTRPTSFPELIPGPF